MIRNYETRDLEALAVLRRDRDLQNLLMAYPPSDPPDNNAVVDWIARKSRDGHFYVIANDADKCVGFVQLSSVHYAGTHAHVGIALAPDARGTGLAQSAFAQIAHQASLIGLTKIITEVRDDNFSALVFYERCGFTYVGRYLDHYKGRDVVIMEKRIA